MRWAHFWHSLLGYSDSFRVFYHCAESQTREKDENILSSIRQFLLKQYQQMRHKQPLIPNNGKYRHIILKQLKTMPAYYAFMNAGFLPTSGWCNIRPNDTIFGVYAYY